MYIVCRWVGNGGWWSLAVGKQIRCSLRSLPFIRAIIIKVDTPIKAVHHLSGSTRDVLPFYRTAGVGVT